MFGEPQRGLWFNLLLYSILKASRVVCNVSLSPKAWLFLAIVTQSTKTVNFVLRLATHFRTKILSAKTWSLHYNWEYLTNNTRGYWKIIPDNFLSAFKAWHVPSCSFRYRINHKSVCGDVQYWTIEEVVPRKGGRWTEWFYAFIEMYTFERNIRVLKRSWLQKVSILILLFLSDFCQGYER